MVAVLDAANDRLNRILRLPSWVPTRRNLREKRALARLDELLDSFIAAHRASGEKPADLLSMLLAATDEDSGIRMSDSQLHEEMMTLFLAGHETTAMALTWTWYLLSQHPEVEREAGARGVSSAGGRAPTVADLPQLPYAPRWSSARPCACIRQRRVSRESRSRTFASAGYNVPQGSLVTVNTYALHRDPRFFDEPERFNPERFRSRLGRAHPACTPSSRSAEARVSASATASPMMEARLILATVVQRCQLSLEPGQEIVPMQLVTVRPKHGIRMRMAVRENANRDRRWMRVTVGRDGNVTNRQFQNVDILRSAFARRMWR